MDSRNFNKLMYKYYEDVDVLYCKMSSPYIYDYTIPVTPVFNIDICKKVNNVVAFELLDASEVLGIDLSENNIPRIKITVNVTRDVIKVVFNILTSNNQPSSLICKALNENNAAEGVFNYYL